MLNDGEEKKLTSEYEWFKDNEEEYLEGLEVGYKLEGKKSRDWLYWLIAFVMVVSFVGFTVDRMSKSAGEIKESQVINRMTAQEAVDHLFDEDGEWIRRDLTEDEYSQIEAKVQELEESSEKVHIKVRLDKARVQLDYQTRALKMISDLKTEDGLVNIDLGKEVLDIEGKEFPNKYNPEYALELEEVYISTIAVISEAYAIQDIVIELGNDSFLDRNELNVLSAKIEGLPSSKRKDKLGRDMGVLEDMYVKQQEKIRIEEVEDKKIREEEERRKKVIEEEKEIQRKKEEEEARQRREIIEEENKRLEEKERNEQEQRDQERKEYERKEQERKEQERREQEQREQEESEREEPKEPENVGGESSNGEDTQSQGDSSGREDE